MKTYYFGQFLHYISNRLRNDKEVIFAAIGAKQYLDSVDDVIYYGSNGIYLKYASARLKNDKEVVLKAVESNGWAFQFASEELRDDKEILLIALNSQHYSYVDVSGVIEYASERLKQDIEIRKLLNKMQCKIVINANKY